MSPEPSRFALIWTALLTWIRIGWCPLDREKTDEPGVSVGPTADHARR